MPKTRESGARGYVVGHAIGNPGRRRPRLTEAERGRRAARARRVLVPAALEKVKKEGFYPTVEKLERHRDKIYSPERLAGWMRTRPEVVRARGTPASKRRRRR